MSQAKCTRKSWRRTTKLFQASALLAISCFLTPNSLQVSFIERVYTGKPTKFIIALYGVLERPRGCAYNATVENVVKSVTMNYSIAHEYVTIAIRPSLEAYKIDGVMMSVNEARRWRTLYNSSYAEEYIAEDIDAILRREHGPRKYDNLSTSIYSQPFWRDDYTETMIQNSLECCLQKIDSQSD